MTSTETQSDFEKKYVSTNIKPGALPYSPEVVERFLGELQAVLPTESSTLSYAILAALFIGAHRGDFVPKMFEEFVVSRLDPATVETVFYQIRESVMAIYAFVGVPWVVPSCLGIVDVLQRNGLENIAKRTFRDPIDVDSLLIMGKTVVTNTYRGVNNNEVRDMLSIGFPEMRKGISLLVWGYNVGGSFRAGLQPRETELFIASAIVASGATRQSRSHIKAALGMGNAFALVKKMIELATEFTAVYGSPLDVLDVEKLAEEITIQ